MKFPGIYKPNINFTLIDSDDELNLRNEGLSGTAIETISQIRRSYPFTFFEKERFRKEINHLSNFFWVKNRFGFCELVNQKTAEYFQTSTEQIEENNEEMFFEVEQHKTLKAFNEISLQTKKAVRLEGISFIERNQDYKFDLLNIPIVDEEQTVEAIITLSFNPKTEKSSERIVNNSFNSAVLSQLPFPAVLISEKGNIKQTNSSFQDIVSVQYNNFVNLKVNEVFSPIFIEYFNDFLLSNNTRKELEIDDLFIYKSTKFVISLGKIFDESELAILLVIQNVIKEQTHNEHSYKQNMIESLIRNNPDAVLICDKENLKFLEVNESALELYEYSREEFLKMDLSDLYFTEDIQLLSESSQIETKEGVFYGPYKHKKKDGSVIQVEISSYNINYQEHQARFNIIKSISDKCKELKIDQSHKAIFDNVDDLLFVIDYTGFIKSFNQSVTRTLGYTKNDLLNSTFASILTDEDRGKLSNLISNVDKAASSVLALKTFDKKEFLTEVVSFPILDINRKVESFILICKSVGNLISEGVENVKQHDSITASEEINEKLNSKFLSELFHELLTSVNVILGFSQELTDGAVQPTEGQIEAAAIIKQNRANLLQSMNAAIEYASLLEQNFSLTISETKITDIVDSLAKDVDDLKNTLNVELAYGRISSSLKFETDSKRFRYLLSLLFSLVAKLSQQKKIYFTAYPRDGDSFIITFRDQQGNSSNQLIKSLNNILSPKEDTALTHIQFSKILISLIRKLIVVLRGKFTILSANEEKPDYGIIFPIKFAAMSEEQLKSVIKGEEEQILKPDSERDKSTKITPQKDINEVLRNELRLETLRQRIKKKETEKKLKKVEKDDEEFEGEKINELVDDNIEFIEIDLQETPTGEEEEEEIEIIETTEPMENIVEPLKKQQTHEKVDISNLSCLYFEDQMDAQVLFNVQMKGLKNLNFALSFEEGLPLLESGSYDFILVDINLHGSYNGLDLLRILRSMPKFENIPIFAASAYVLPGDQQKYLLAGFNGFISKPIFRDQMIDLLAEVFNQSHQS